MSDVGPSKAIAIPLLLELARARRAREFYPTGHPTLREAQRRLNRLWRTALADRDELELRVERGSFRMMGLSELRGPGIDELASELESRGIRRLRVASEFEPLEMDMLVDALWGNDAGRGDVEQILAAAGVRNITTSERPFGVLHERSAGSASESSDERDAHPDEIEAGPGGEAPTTENTPEGVDTDTVVQAPLGAAEETGPETADGEDDDSTEGAAGPERVSDLVQLLAELERCDDLGGYCDVADRIGECANALLESESCFHSYRAALVFSRHAGDQRGRPAEICAEAQKRLWQLLEREEFFRFVVDLAAAGEGLTCVQATQVIVACGEAAAQPLLDLHIGSDEELARRAASILIAMADDALQVIVQELSSPTLERARRAAQLLGDLQHPRAVEHLIDALHNNRNPGIRPKLARALIHIGSEKAVDALIEALNTDAECAELAARCLGEARQPRVTQVLAAAIEDRSGHPEEVRREAIRSLGKLGGAEAMAALRSLLEQGSLLNRKRVRPLRIAAAQAIGRIGNNSARQTLQANLRHGDTAVRRACRAALERLPDENPSDATA